LHKKKAQFFLSRKTTFHYMSEIIQPADSPSGADLPELATAFGRLAMDVIWVARRDEQFRGGISRFVAVIEQLIRPLPSAADELREDLPKSPIPATDVERAVEPAVAPDRVESPISINVEVVDQLQASLEDGFRGLSGRPAIRPKPLASTPFEMIQACRLKAEACRWNVQRRELMDQFDEVVRPKDEDLIRRAKAVPDCFLWMSTAYAPNPKHVEVYLDLAACFDNAAVAAHHLSLVLEESDDDAA
jgi:hypothetical protein